MRHILKSNLNDVRVLPSFPDHWQARVRICWLVAYLLMVQMVHQHHHPTRLSKVGWSPLCMRCIPQISYDWPSEFKERDLTYGWTMYQICHTSTLFPSSLKRYISNLSNYFIKTTTNALPSYVSVLFTQNSNHPINIVKQKISCNIWHWNDICMETFIGL